jgi:hypothetical protein
MDREVELREFVSAQGAALSRAALVLLHPAVCSSAPTGSPTREQPRQRGAVLRRRRPRTQDPDPVQGLPARLGTRPLHTTTRVATNAHLQTRRAA